MQTVLVSYPGNDGFHTDGTVVLNADEQGSMQYFGMIKGEQGVRYGRGDLGAQDISVTLKWDLEAFQHYAHEFMMNDRPLEFYGAFVTCTRA
jgi:hypothetical protein